MTAESYSAFYIRRLHSLLGIIPIGVFFCEHVLTNSLAFFEGPEKFNQAVLFLQGLPFVRFLEIFLIGIPILLHAVLGLIIWWNSRCNPQEYGYMRNWLHFLQRWTGIAALVFIVVHVWGMRISWTFHSEIDHVDFAYVSQVFSHSLLIPFYVIGVACSSFHFANGLWNFLITWGIAVGERSQRNLLALCGIVGIVVFCGFMFSLAAFVAPGA
ncbi:MAG TPA: succinate dehydrogenase [bacterium]|nr:succinate dehydrogenase [bacterium]HQP97650.1 succinate dehydrogenase [bacterium]